MTAPNNIRHLHCEHAELPKPEASLSYRLDLLRERLSLGGHIGTYGGDFREAWLPSSFQFTCQFEYAKWFPPGAN
jgi:hypothetical protein